MDAEAYRVEIEVSPIKKFWPVTSSLERTQTIKIPQRIKPMLLKAFDGSLKYPELILSHHLELSPIL